MLPADVVLSLLTLDDAGVLVYARTYPCKRWSAGDPVATTKGTKRPYYVIDGANYAPPMLLAALQAGDPSMLHVGDPARAKKPGQHRVRPRDLEILSALQAGATYAEVGGRYGISRQRIKQIVDMLTAKGYAVPSTEMLRRDIRDQARAAYALERYGAHADALAHSPELRAYLGVRLTRIKQRALREGVPFDLTVSDLYPLPSHCPVLGIPLVYSGPQQGALDDYLSIDRIVPEHGYTKENTVLISARANRLKSDATPEELGKLAEFYCNKVLNKP